MTLHVPIFDTDRLLSERNISSDREFAFVPLCLKTDEMNSGFEKTILVEISEIVGIN